MIEHIGFDAHAGVAIASGVARPRRASYSALSTWRSCPAKWMAGRAFPPSKDWASPLLVGGLAHAALEAHMRSAPDDPDPDWMRCALDGMMLARRRVAERGWGDDPAPHVPMPDGRVASDADWARLTAERLAGLDLSVFRPSWSPIALEEAVDASVWGVPMMGSVDYRDEDGSVVDWKTGKVPAGGQGRLNHADQLRVYRKLLESKGVGVARLSDAYVEHGVMVDADMSDASMTATGDRMKGAWDELSASAGRDGDGRFPLRPSPLCGWCPLSRVCPLAQIRSGKARKASLELGADPSLPIFDRAGTHGVSDSPLRRMEDAMTVSLEDMLNGAGTVKPKQSVASRMLREREVKARASVAPDPWATVDGEDALRHWGVPAERTEPEPPVTEQPVGNGSPVGETTAGSVTEPDHDAGDAGVKPARRAGSLADMIGVSDDSREGRERTGTEPANVSEAAMPEDGTDAPKEAKRGTKTARRMKGMRELRPFDGTFSSDGIINVAGYGFGLMQQTVALAYGLHGTDDDGELREVTVALMKAQWCAARAAWGGMVPDIPGLADGRPDAGVLDDWMDSTMCRDAHRVIAGLLHADPALLDCSDVAGVRERIGLAARTAARLLKTAASFSGVEGRSDSADGGTHA